jgi:hypothetical protein
MTDTTEPTSVSIEVDAAPEQVYALVADLPRMGEWSPECVKCTWKGGATGAVEGARFKGFNRRGIRRWSTNGTVVTADPGRELAFDVSAVLGLPVARWSYRIEPRDGGSRVTEVFDDRRGTLITVLGRIVSGVGDRNTHNAETMQTTLERIKSEAEAGAATI